MYETIIIVSVHMNQENSTVQFRYAMLMNEILLHLGSSLKLEGSVYIAGIMKYFGLKFNGIVVR